MVLKIPTIEDFDAYKGAHTDNLWEEVGDDWQCPVCDRTKFEILKWTNRQSGWGWLAALCTQGKPWTTERFEPKIVCQNCNRAGYNVARKMQLPSGFQFSPAELREFVSAQPHCFATYDLEKAQIVIDDLRARSAL